MNEISPIQAKILKKLLVDGRKSISEIAKEIGESKETVSKQVKEMEQAEIIKGATIHFNYKGFGYKAVASLLITTDPQQSDTLVAYVKKMPDIYAAFNRGPKGDIRVVTTLRTLQQLDEVKDAIKRHFPISNMKTVIWTDVREMHGNLKLLANDASETPNTEELRIGEKNNHIDTEIDEKDIKLAEKLAQNGRAPMQRIAKEIGISSESTKKRYEKLKRKGLLKVTIQTDLTKLGYHAMAVLYLSTTHENSLSIINEISRIPDVFSIMKTSGDYDLQIYVMVRDIEELLRIQEKFWKIQGVTEIDMEMSRCSKKWPTPHQHMSTF
ncbi:MAG: Lrp/AsnC family transcriptional regulator [Candidatus Bathyarchaeota archaeon]|nr:Lrp/AsnC family transcriptional regulator [Candidatus Bathyarchaeota archaeon]